MRLQQFKRQLNIVLHITVVNFSQSTSYSYSITHNFKQVEGKNSLTLNNLKYIWSINFDISFLLTAIPFSMCKFFSKNNKK